MVYKGTEFGFPWIYSWQMNSEERIKFVPNFPPSIFMETTILSWFIVNGFNDVYIFLSTTFISVNGFIYFYIFESTTFIIMIGGILSSKAEPVDFLTVHILLHFWMSRKTKNIKVFGGFLDGARKYDGASRDRYDSLNTYLFMKICNILLISHYLGLITVGKLFS